jgi:hypothetical protein
MTQAVFQSTLLLSPEAMMVGERIVKLAAISAFC